MTKNNLSKRILRTVKWINYSVKGMFIFFVSYNAYFGWNLKPSCKAENFCDVALHSMIYLSIGFLISALIDAITLIALNNKEE